MNCADVRDRLLEVSPGDIERALSPAAAAAGPGEKHLADCDACAALARRLLSDHRGLATALEAARPVRPLGEAVAAARLESGRRDGRRTRAAWAVAAATLVALAGIRLFQPGGGVNEDGLVSPAGLVAAFVPEVEALLDESVVVLETEEEDVVVFWFYQGRGE